MDNRKSKTISVIALVAGIVGLSLGFAAFTQTLTINASATVTPNANDSFKVAFSGNPTCEIAGGTSADITYEAGSASSGTKINGMSASFKAPGQSVTCTATIANTGALDAFLTAINAGGAIGCTKKTTGVNTDDQATDALVTEACKGILVTYTVDGKDIATTDYQGAHNPSSYKASTLTKGTGTHKVTVKIEYKSGSTLADGPFTVTIPDATFNYSSAT